MKELDALTQQNNIDTYIFYITGKKRDCFSHEDRITSYGEVCVLIQRLKFSALTSILFSAVYFTSLLDDITNNKALQHNASLIVSARFYCSLNFHTAY